MIDPMISIYLYTLIYEQPQSGMVKISVLLQQRLGISYVNNLETGFILRIGPSNN